MEQWQINYTNSLKSRTCTCYECERQTDGNAIKRDDYYICQPCADGKTPEFMKCG